MQLIDSSVKSIRLKKGKERPILQGHQWIYSGAIQGKVEKKGTAEVFDSAGNLLGLAFLNPGHSIAAHMIACGNESLESAIIRKIHQAINLRKKWFDPLKTNAFRLINAEGDGLAGLIVDAYADALVLQISHGEMDLCKEWIVRELINALHPRAIYEKSTSFLRKKEGLQETRSLLYGDTIPEVEVLENGLRYAVDLVEGQKTGLFLDQREMRSLIRELAFERNILNAFAYTGGFSVSALAGNAARVDSVEMSRRCGPAVQKNIVLNQLDAAKHRFFCEDVFDFMKTNAAWDYDLVILDPPAFVKKRTDIDNAFRAYKGLNQRAIEKMKSGSLLLTCSCSYHVDESLFQNIVFRAALEAKRDVQILGRHRMALDHPISLFHPESGYLKSLLLAVK